MGAVFALVIVLPHVILSSHVPHHPLRSRLCDVPCAVDLCLWAQETWRSSSSLPGLLQWDRWGVLCRQAPALGAPCLEGAQVGPSAANRGPPVGPISTMQYISTLQYVNDVWGPGGLPVFLNFGASRPLRNLMDVILATPVRCM